MRSEVLQRILDGIPLRTKFYIKMQSHVVMKLLDLGIKLTDEQAHELSDSIRELSKSLVKTVKETKPEMIQ